MLSMGAITMDCHEVAPLAKFWGELTGRQVAEGASEEFAQLPAGEGGLPMMFFIRVPDELGAKNRSTWI